MTFTGQFSPRPRWQRFVRGCNFFTRAWLRFRRRRNDAVVEEALVRLFNSEGQDDAALRAMVEHTLGRRIYNKSLLDDLAKRNIYGEAPE